MEVFNRKARKGFRKAHRDSLRPSRCIPSRSLRLRNRLLIVLADWWLRCLSAKHARSFAKHTNQKSPCQFAAPFKFSLSSSFPAGPIVVSAQDFLA